MFYKITVTGAVQGVGFRPFVFREAKKRGLKGYVRNTSSGVEIIVDDKSFVSVLQDKKMLPPLAHIEIVDIGQFYTDSSFFPDFQIIPSKSGVGSTFILPDVSICEDCISEISDSKNRRKGYYFTTCTNCGPRFSMVLSTPYDRRTTTMSKFNMCEKCEKEYSDPSDRRFHAQTIACPKCGPELNLSYGGKISARSDEAVKKVCQEIKKGYVVAVKGIGGYHLCCDAENDDAVRKLRQVIRRPNKPLAIMVKGIEDAGRIAIVGKEEKSALLSGKRPIVVLNKKKRQSYSLISPLGSIGIMLPYTALHYLILDILKKPLVMTSCNLPGEPINMNSQSLSGLELSNQRDISNPVDDSVLKFIGGKQIFLRRSRGFAPMPIDVDIKDAPDMISFGSQESNTISIYKGGKVFVSQHIGDTSHVNVMDALKKTANFFIKVTGAKPVSIACDMHPDYYTVACAKEFALKIGAELVPVQHHVAHAYSVGLENGLSSFAAISCDGSGYGQDGNVWGGEVFLFKDGKDADGSRVGHLEEHMLVGGESAVNEPKKMLFGILSKFLDDKELNNQFGGNSAIWKRQIDDGFNVQKTTSTGRVLDAASFFLGFCEKRTYTGEPAIALESAVNGAKPYDIEPLIGKGQVKVLKTTPLFEFLWDMRDKDKKRLAATVHDYLSRGLFSIADSASRGFPIVFSGGVAYNRYITEHMLEKGVIVNSKVPCGDGGISFGQVGYVLRSY